MGDTWTIEICPKCGEKNWLPQLSEDDIQAYTCHVCMAEVRLFVGEYLEEYKPHLNGTDPSDDNQAAFHWDGHERPE